MIFYCSAECLYAECRYAECRGALGLLSNPDSESGGFYKHVTSVTYDPSKIHLDASGVTFMFS